MKVFNAMALVVALSAATHTFAGTIAVADSNRAILESAYAKKVLASTEKDINPQQAKMAALEKEINAIGEKAKQNAKVMSDADRQALAVQYQSKANEYKSVQEGVQKRLNNAQEDIIKTLVPKLDQLIPQMSSERDYDMIIESKYVIWKKDAVDVTADLTKRLDAM